MNLRPVLYAGEPVHLVIEIGPGDSARVSARVTSPPDALVLLDGVFPSRAQALDAITGVARSWLEVGSPFAPPPPPEPSAAEQFLERMGPVAEQLLELQLRRARRAVQRAHLLNPKRRRARKGGKR